MEFFTFSSLDVRLEMLRYYNLSTKTKLTSEVYFRYVLKIKSVPGAGVVVGGKVVGAENNHNVQTKVRSKQVCLT